MMIAQTQKRYLHYQCRFCERQGRRYRVIAHALKEHIPLDRVPYYCTMCNFRCQDPESLLGHVKNYARHRAEEARSGTPDYQKVLKKGENPVQVCDLVFVSQGQSGKLVPAEIQAEEDIYADQEEAVMIDGLLVPKWLAGPEACTPPVVKREVLNQTYVPPYVPEYVPSQITQTSSALNQGCGVGIGNAMHHLQWPAAQTSPSQRVAVLASPSQRVAGSRYLKSKVPLPALQLSPNQIVPQLSQQKVMAQLSPGLGVPTLVGTPVSAGKLLQVSTPLLDEAGIMPTLEDKSDPLLQEEELRQVKRPAEVEEVTQPKRSCLEDAPPSTEAIVADAISKGMERVCRCLDEHLKTMTRMERTMSKQLDEAQRIERRVTAILRAVEQKAHTTEDLKRVKSVVHKK